MGALGHRRAKRRLFERFGDGPLDKTTVYRWIAGQRAVPSWAVAMVRLFSEIPERRRRKILEELELPLGRPPPPKGESSKS